MAEITINLWDGTRERFLPDRAVLITVRDRSGRHTLSKFERGNIVHIEGLEVRENADDDWAVIASARGSSDTGFFPVKVSTESAAVVDLMLRPRHPVFNFARASWDALREREVLHSFLAGTNDPLARDQYSDLMERNAPALACLLNITSAISLLPLPQGEELLPLFRSIQLKPRSNGAAEGLQQDRFFAWVDPKITGILEEHTGKPSMIFAPATSVLHPGADLSYKEIRLGEANLQFTFHRDEPSPQGTDWLKIEMDMDYYHDPGAHIFLEVIPNQFVRRVFKKAHLTDPATVFALRWMAGRHAKEQPEFDPLYVLRAA